MIRLGLVCYGLAEYWAHEQRPCHARESSVY